MKNIQVTLSANAGVCVQIGDRRVWIDALHDEKQSGFSAAPENVLRHPAFQAPDLIVYTHCHGDHFSEEWTREAMRLWPKAKVILPEPVFPQQLLMHDPICFFEDRGMTLRCFSLPHEGAQYAGVAHYGVQIEYEDRVVLAVGDCATASPVLLHATQGRRADVAIMDFPWLALNKGRAALKVLSPKCVLGCHLPFAQDDTCGYRPAAMKSVQLLENMDVRLLMEPFQTEIITG